MLADPAELRLRPEVMAEIEAARATGPKVALVSASDQRQVDKVANALGVFDEAFGSGQLAESGKNLSGRIKADFLSVRFGRGGFDYIGDSMTDAPVWAAARQAIVAGPDKAAPRRRHVQTRRAHAARGTRAQWGLIESHASASMGQKHPDFHSPSGKPAI